MVAPESEVGSSSVRPRFTRGLQYCGLYTGLSPGNRPEVDNDHAISDREMLPLTMRTPAVYLRVAGTDFGLSGLASDHM